MFKKARIKLTIWYVAIIMLVSLSFSAFIYKSVSTELQRRFNTIEDRLQLRRYGLQPPAGQIRFFIEDLEIARHRVFFLLAYTNGVIFIFSTLAGYFLAGKTLEPIEQSHENQKRFVADASHELRTPLTSLRTEIEVALRDKKLPLKDAKGLLKSNLAEVEKMQRLSDYLLTLSRHQSNGESLTKQQVDLQNIVKQAVAQNSALAKNKNIKLESHTDSVTVSGEKQSLTQMVSILVNNAIKYSGSKTTVTIKLTKTKRTVTLKVIDQGIGIAKQDLPRIFDRFYRADTSRSKTDTDGYGLGLSIAKTVAELHGGTITVTSELDKGSTFTVRLPL